MILTVPQSGDPIWQWAKAEQQERGSYRDIDKANSSTYEAGPTMTLGSYLRATVSATTDGEGADKSAMVVSDYTRCRESGARNMAPAFPDDDDRLPRQMLTRASRRRDR